MKKLVEPKKPRKPPIPCKPLEPSPYETVNYICCKTFSETIDYKDVLSLMKKYLVDNNYEIVEFKEECVSIEIEQDHYDYEGYSKAELIISYNSELRRKRSESEFEFLMDTYKKNLKVFEKNKEKYDFKIKEFEEKNKIYLERKKIYDNELAKLTRDQKLKLFQKLKKELGEP